MSQQQEQLLLDIPIRPKQEVRWLNVRPRERYRLLGRSIINELIYQEGHSLPTTTSIEVDRLAEVKDPDLRYALRFAAAIDAVGWVGEDREGGCTAYKDMVYIEATNEGINSRLVGATYSGKIDDDGHDTFMDGIYGANSNK